MARMFKYAVNIVFRRKLRTFLTSLGITISVILLSFIIFGMQDLKTLIISEFTSRFKPNEIMVSNTSMNMVSTSLKKSDVKKKPVIITPEIVSDIEKIDGVEAAQPILLISALDTSLEGDDTPYPYSFIIGWDVPGNDKYFKSYQGEAGVPKDGEVFVDKKFVDFYEISTTDIIGKNIELKGSPSSIFSTGSKALMDKKYIYKISGVVDTGSNQLTVLMSTNQAASILAEIGGFESAKDYLNNMGYYEIRVETEDGTTSQVKDKIKDQTHLSVMTTDEVLKFIDILTVGLTFALMLFGLISAIVASIGIVNTMVMSIYEQTREIGILKAIGASNTQILIIFLIQSGLIGLLGGLMGLIVVFAAMRVSDPTIVKLLQDAGFSVTAFFHFQPINALLIALASVAIGVIAGIYPSMKAASLDPVKALKYE